MLLQKFVALEENDKKYCFFLQIEMDSKASEFEGMVWWICLLVDNKK